MAEEESSPPRKKIREESGLQFDLNPRTVNVTEFVEARALEITQLLAVVNNASLPAGEVAQGPRTFVQRLPRHMRRRAMSYNIKRLPRRIKAMAESTIKESKHRKKPPSRRWRRRPRNLLNAYIRRQRRVQWLETHIWHAKRFHMVDYGGWRLPNRSCQRGFRANYRDAMRHCVVQDLSFYTCFELEAPELALIDRLNTMCEKSVSQTFSNAKAMTGRVEGRATLYEPGAYPFGCIGTIRFLYRTKNEANRTLWIWMHPGLEAKMTELLKRLFKLEETKKGGPTPDDGKKTVENLNQYHLSRIFEPPTYRSIEKNEPVTLRILKHHLVRFRLIGPKAGAILSQVLHEPSSISDVCSQQWDAWKIFSRIDVGRVEAGLVLPLITMDPRFFTEYKKRLPTDTKPYVDTPPSIDPALITSPLWDPESRRRALETKMSDHELNKIRQRSNQVSKSVLDSLDGKANLVPIMLVQQPPSTLRDHLGMGPGWDLILPAGWAMPFWVALQYATARAVGLDFQRHFSMETANQTDGFPYFWPDTDCGRVMEEKEADEMKNRYFRRPTNRRVDYELLRITHPFRCPWPDLIDGWMKISANGSSDGAMGSFFVLRDRVALRRLELAFHAQKAITSLCGQYSRALVPIRLSAIGKGLPKSRALICLPTKEDLRKVRAQRSLNDPEVVAEKKTSVKKEAKMEDVEDFGFISLVPRSIQDMELGLATIFEDKKEKRLEERKKKEKEKKKRRKKERAQKKEDQAKMAKFDNVIDSCQRRILGYVVNGDYSLATGRGQAIGFCSLLALEAYGRLMMESKDRRMTVLYRNVHSKYYRAAVLSVLT